MLPFWHYDVVNHSLTPVHMAPEALSTSKCWFVLSFCTFRRMICESDVNLFDVEINDEFIINVMLSVWNTYLS